MPRASRSPSRSCCRRAAPRTSRSSTSTRRRWSGWASTPTITTVDRAQYNERTNAYDFDMTYYRRGLSLSPGNEQKLYWGSAGVDDARARATDGHEVPGRRGDDRRDADRRRTEEDFVAAAKALDRVLTTGRYVIPIYSGTSAGSPTYKSCNTRTDCRSTATGSASSPMSGGMRTKSNENEHDGIPAAGASGRLRHRATDIRTG